MGSCRDYSCSEVTNNKIKFLVQAGLDAQKTYTLKIGGITNPRSFKETGKFMMTTMDIDGISHINEGYEKTIRMSVAGDMGGFKVKQTSNTNGVVNQFEISFQATIPVLDTDKFSLTLPSEMKAPADDTTLDCKPVKNVKKIKCTVQGNKLEVYFLEFTDKDSAFIWTFEAITNAPSTRPSVLIDVYVKDQYDEVVSGYPAGEAKVTNYTPADITAWKLE